ncbi:MAG: hypothetical protein M0R39_16740 [Prolixibacteraceae bacterium]|jgi:hypothetical protein|nr:hypothetical protein [Prolixibacteraceae bacterium]
MKKRIIVTLLVSLLIIFSIFITIKYNISQDNLFNEKNKYADEFIGMTSFFNLLYEEGSHLDEFAYELSKNYQVKNKLLCVFSSNTCSKCIVEELNFLKMQFSKDRLSFDNIVLVCLTDEGNLFEDYPFKEYAKLFRTVCLNFGGELNRIKQKPFYIYITTTGKYNYFYIPELIPSFKERYFEDVSYILLKNSDKSTW